MIDSTTILFSTASTERQFKDAANLFLEYAASLDIDLAFQDFAKEVESIQLQYSKPFGALILAYHEEQAIGCAGIRRLDDKTAELKRMFVQSRFRGYKAGQKLLSMAIDIAKELDYKKIRLDSIPSMRPALNLYRSHGFYEIPAYRFNPVEGAIYMEKDLG